MVLWFLVVKNSGSLVVIQNSKINFLSALFRFSLLGAKRALFQSAAIPLKSKSTNRIAFLLVFRTFGAKRALSPKAPKENEKIQHCGSRHRLRRSQYI